MVNVVEEDGAEDVNGEMVHSGPPDHFAGRTGAAGAWCSVALAMARVLAACLTSSGGAVQSDSNRN